MKHIGAATLTIAILSGPAGATHELQLAEATSNVCRTPSVSCVLPTSAPIGSPCWCATPSGPVTGKIG